MGNIDRKQSHSMMMTTMEFPFVVNEDFFKFIYLLQIPKKGSYNLQLEDGSVQTIFYVSDANGHRISIGQPFTESEITQKPIVSVRRVAPTRPTRKLETERNVKKEEEKFEDHTEKVVDDYESDYEDV